MSAIQRFLLKVLPTAWGEAMRAESMQWQLRCEACGVEHSIWELGGIRWKAKGTRRHLATCAQCGVRGPHLIYKP